MIRGKSVLAIIPARGGSKGVPRKNIKPLADKPLIAWTIEAAKQSTYLDRVVVSTDDSEIADVATCYGAEVPFFRPAELAKDDTPGIAPILHALENLPGYDYVVLLQPTSPLRLTEDIDTCIEMCEVKQARAIVSVTPTDKPPQWMYQIGEDSRLTPLLSQDQLLTRRQDAPQTYSLNGAVYVAETNWLQETQSFLTDQTLAYVMPRNRSIDIDEEIDFLIAEAVIGYFQK